MRHPVLVIGNGICAGALADNLLAGGIDLILASRERQPAPVKVSPLPGKNRQPEVLAGADLIACAGAVGGFSVILQKDHDRLIRTVAAVAVAEDCRRQPNYELYRLAPGPCVTSLSHLMAPSSSQQLLEAAKQRGAKIVFLTGLLQESTPVFCGEMMDLCLRLQNEGNLQVYVLAGNLKVAGPGLEALHRRSKADGVVYFKFNRKPPQIGQDGTGVVTILFEDEITGHPFRLQPDLTVVDETLLPAPGLSELASVLKVDRGPDGFLQTDNVRRTGVFTNRRGVLALGPSRGTGSEKAFAADAAAAALAVAQLLTTPEEPPAVSAVIDAGRCVRCLTCFRLCPHAAVTLSGRPAIAPESCENCGLCVAECPRGAITSGTPAPHWLQAGRGGAECSDGTFEPHLAVLCCSRSAMAAWKLSALWGLPRSCRLSVLPVDCGAAVSVDLIYRTFQAGADGVLVMSCHPGNCHSEQGPQHVRNRIERIREQMDRIGLDPGRLQSATIAANMGIEFSGTVAGFAETIRGLGPLSNIKSQISNFK